MTEGGDMAKDRTHLYVKGFSLAGGTGGLSFGKVIVTDKPPRPPRPKRFIKLAKALFKVVKVVGSIGSAIRGGQTIWDVLEPLLGRKRQPTQA